MGNTVRAIASYMLVFVMLAFIFHFGSASKPTELGLAILGVAICLSFVNLERLESFKGAGFEARMRRVVDEAYATLDTLKEVAKSAIATNIDMVNHSNRVGGLKADEKLKHIVEARRICDKLGIADGDIQDKLDSFYRLLTWDFVQKVVDAIRSSGGSRETVGFAELQAKVVRSTINYPTATEMRTVAAAIQHPHRTEELEETVKDFEHFVAHRTLRRPPA